MIRQHFYPKTYFRHRSLSKDTSKVNSLFEDNCEIKHPREIQCNQIKFKRKKSFVHDKNQKVYLNNDMLQNQALDKLQHKPQEKPKFSNKKLQAFIQEQAYTELSEQTYSGVLKQIQNRPGKEMLQQQKTNQKIKPSLKENDVKNLFIKSDRKQIVKANRNSYRVLGHSSSENDSFFIEGEWINTGNRKKSSARKLASADASHRCYRRSIERKKKQDQTPAQIIINASLSTVDVPNNKLAVHSERLKQVPVFQKMTQNLINLNLSKAIKYRQSSMQDKIRRQRKNSQKITLENIENRTHELEQKVRGWEIMVDDDVDFQ